MKRNLLLVACLLSLTFTLKGWTDEDEEHEGKRDGASQVLFQSRKLIYKPAALNPKFKAECTSCHMAYLPGLLPERSWTKMMNSLETHFGEDASLDEKTKKEILDFLIQNSSDHAYSRRGKKILATIGKNEAPQRISETGYFNRKHDEIAASVYKRKAIGSKANCLACHAGAEAGDFSDDGVRIPKENEVPVKSKK